MDPLITRSLLILVALIAGVFFVPTIVRLLSREVTRSSPGESTATVRTIASGIGLHDSERRQLAALLQDAPDPGSKPVVVRSLRVSPSDADVVLVPVVSSSTLAGLRRRFPVSRIVVVEVYGHPSIRSSGMLAAMLPSVDGFAVVSTVEELARIVVDRAHLPSTTR